MSDTPEKRCTKCGEEFPATTEFFHRDRNTKDRLRYQCKECTNKKARAYTAQPHVREKIREREKIYYSSNADALEKKRAYGRVYQRTRRKRPEVREQQRIYQRTYNRIYRKRPEVHEKRRVAGQIYRSRPEVREYSRTWHKEYHSRPEIREHKQAYHKARYSNPETRGRIRAYYKVYSSSPRGRDKGNARSRRYRSKPEAQARIHAYNNRPEVQEYRREWSKVYHARPEIKDRWHVHMINRRARKKAIPGSHTAEQSREQYDRQKGKCYWCGQKLTWGKHHEDHIIPLTREGSSNDISNIVITHPHCNLSRNNKLPHEAYKFGRLL